MVKFKSFVPGDKFQPENDWQELYMAIDDYLKREGDSFSVEVELAAISTVRTAAARYAKEKGFNITTNAKDNKLWINHAGFIQIASTVSSNGKHEFDNPADEMRPKRWKSLLVQLDGLPLDGFEGAFHIGEDIDLAQKAVLNYSSRNLKDVNYKFRSRIAGDVLFVRKVKA